MIMTCIIISHTVIKVKKNFTLLKMYIEIVYNYQNILSNIVMWCIIWFNTYFLCFII